MTRPEPAPILLDTAEDIAAWLGHRVSPATIRSWAARGHIRRFPGDLYYAVDVADYLDNRPPVNAARARR